jgi:hypothetical protein
MSIVTHAELLEIVPDLRSMAAGEAMADVRDALNRLADRYAMMGAEGRGRFERVIDHAKV